MANGVSVSPEEFEALPQKQQLSAIFHNLSYIKTAIDKGREDFQNHESSDRFHNWTTYTLLTILIILAGLGKYLSII